MSAKTIMLQGTMSHVGKTILTAGLCRLFSELGYRTAPFKAQNLSSKETVLADGSEIGTGQAIQARAAGIIPVSHESVAAESKYGWNIGRVSAWEKAIPGSCRLLFFPSE